MFAPQAARVCHESQPVNSAFAPPLGGANDGSSVLLGGAFFAPTDKTRRRSSPLSGAFTRRSTLS